jgi:hypothetical protein
MNCLLSVPVLQKGVASNELSWVWIGTQGACGVFPGEENINGRLFFQEHRVGSAL